MEVQNTSKNFQMRFARKMANMAIKKKLQMNTSYKTKRGAVGVLVCTICFRRGNLYLEIAFAMTRVLMHTAPPKHARISDRRPA